MRAIALPLIVAVLAFAGTFFLQRRIADPSGPSGALSWSDLVNLFALLVGFVSLIVALAAYRDSIRAGEEQQKSLEGARRALESVVSTTTEQQRLLAENLRTSEAHLKLVQIQVEAETKRLARKPVVSLGFGNAPQADIDAGKSFALNAPADNIIPIDFFVTNSGDKEVEFPVVILLADPATIFVYELGTRFERPERNRLQISGAQVPDIIPGVPARYRTEIQVPPGVDEFRILFQVSGRNLPAVFKTLHIVVNRQLPPPQ